MSFDLKLIKNGLALNPDGSLQTVSENIKLAQDVLKIVLTSSGSNKIFRWYGSNLSSRVIGNIFSVAELETEISRTIQDAISNLIALQKSQSKTQYVSAGETIAAVRYVRALKSETDPREYEVAISLLTRKLTVVEESFTLRLTR